MTHDMPHDMPPYNFEFVLTHWIIYTLQLFKVKKTFVCHGTVCLEWPSLPGRRLPVAASGAGQL